jgi:hypothetical protein
LDFYLSSLKQRPNNNSLNNTIANKSLQEQIMSNELASCLCSFFKESLSSSATSNLAPACYFQLFRILHDSVNNFALLIEDKKYSRDIQDITHKLFELCNSLVALSLEQTTWLRKNYAVKLGTSSSSSSSAQPNNNSSISGANSNTSQNTALNNSVAGSGSISSSTTIIAGAGPSMGGAILIHNSDKSNISLSNVSTSTALTNSTSNGGSAINTSGYGGSNSIASSVKSSKTNGIVNNRTLSDLENGNFTHFTSLNLLK